MIIEETNIPNVLPDNIQESKIFLANSIIRNVYPLFNEVYNWNITEIENLKKDLKEKKTEVSVRKNELQEIVDSYKLQKKLSKLFDRIEKLIKSGLIYDGTLKHETIILLKIATKLSEEKIDYHLQETLRTISKRFSK